MSFLVDLVNWKNPVTSSSALIVFNLLFILISFGGYTLLTLLCYFTLFAMALGFGFSRLMTVNEGRYELVSRTSIENNLLSIYELVNSSASGARDIILWRDITVSAQVTFVVWVVSVVSNMFSMPLLAFIAVWTVFLNGFVQQQYKVFVAPLVDPHVTKVKSVVKQTLSKIPKYSDLKSE